MAVSRSLYPPSQQLPRGEGAKGEGRAEGQPATDAPHDSVTSATSDNERLLCAVDVANAPWEDNEAEGGGWSTSRAVTATKKRRSPAMRGLGLQRPAVRGSRDVLQAPPVRSLVLT